MSHVEQLQNIINDCILTQHVTVYEYSSHVIELVKQFIVSHIVKNNTLPQSDKQAMLCFLLNDPQVNEMIKKGFEFKEQTMNKKAESEVKVPNDNPDTPDSAHDVMDAVNEYNECAEKFAKTIEKTLTTMIQKTNVRAVRDPQYQELANNEKTLEDLLNTLNKTKLVDESAITSSIKGVEKAIQTIKGNKEKIVLTQYPNYVNAMQQLKRVQNIVKPISITSENGKASDIAACMEFLKPYIAEMISDEAGIKTINFKTTGTREDIGMYRGLCNCIKYGHSVLGYYLNTDLTSGLYYKLQTIFSYLGFDVATHADSHVFILTRDDTHTQKYYVNETQIINTKYVTDVAYAHDIKNFK